MGVSLSFSFFVKTYLLQVIITTYQTLCLDFTIPASIEEDDELEYLLDNGYISSPVPRITSTDAMT